MAGLPITKMFPKRPPRIEDIESGSAAWGDADERISYDKKHQQWVYEADDIEYHFDYDNDKWVPESDNGQRKRRHSTDEENETGGDSVSGKESAAVPAAEKENRETIKRIKKERLAQMREEIKKLKAASAGSVLTAASELSPSSAIFVSQLPEDITLEELIESFEKYGMLAEDLNDEKRVKMYVDEAGAFKKEALIIYLNPASAKMAIDMLDGVYLRGPARDKERINVQFARLKPKKEEEKKSSERASSGRLTEEDKRKLQQRKQELKRKLTEWDDDNSRVEDTKKRILGKQIVIRNMFRKMEFKSDAMLEQDIKEDIAEECQRMGITIDTNKITVYDGSGVVVVKFGDPELAGKCLDSFDGRFYDGLQLAVSVATGERYLRSDDAESEDGRLESFGKWIESGKS